MWNEISKIEIQRIQELCPITDESDRLAKYPRWVYGCYLPIAAYCCAFLTECCQGIPIEKAAVMELGEALTERLTLLGKAAAMQILFVKEKENRTQLSEDRREDIWLYMMRYGYPILRRRYQKLTVMLEESILFFLKANVFFLDALRCDWNILQSTCGAPICVTSIFQDMKELHARDKNVHIVTFNNASSVIFKQEREGSVRFWSDCCEAMQEADILSVYCPWSRERNGYVWQECIKSVPARSKHQKATYYYHAGQLLCLFYLLNSTDMHRENVIWKDVWPVVIDTETVCNGQRSEAQDSTVQQTYFLPSCHRSPYLPMDFATLANGDGKQALPHIRKGFSETYQKMREWKNIFTDYQTPEPVWFRYILHSTWLYATILERATWKLTEINRNHISYLEEFKNLRDCERESLSKGYLPVFLQSFNSRDLYDEYGDVVIKDFFRYSPKETIKKRLENFTDENLAVQLRLIQECFEQEENNAEDSVGAAGVCKRDYQ